MRPREAATIVLKHPEDFNKAHQVIDKCADMDKASSVPQVSKRGRLLYVSHKQSHLKYEQLNTLRDQNKNTHVVVYRH